MRFSKELPSALRIAAVDSARSAWMSRLEHAAAVLEAARAKGYGGQRELAERIGMCETQLSRYANARSGIGETLVLAVERAGL